MRPFSILVPDAELADLRTRLVRIRFPDELVDPAAPPWGWGADGSFMRDIIAYWREEFDWRHHERALNAYPQYLASVGGTDIHFVHTKPDGASPLPPLLLLHGWPATFTELLPLADALRDRHDVVVPSIPGFGFSTRPATPGWNAWRVADALADLMTQLGYDRFIAHGGDIGAGIATALALRHPDRLVGLHVNYIPGSYRPDYHESALQLSEDERAFLSSAEHWFAEEGAYAHLQRTFPQTAAFALNDSPAGLASWIIEKFYRWSDSNGDVFSRFSRDALLVNVSIYWFTQTIAASMRYYVESRRAPFHFRPGERVRVPTAIARFRREAPFPPRTWIERGYDVVRFSEFPTGGHFAASEETRLLAEDIAAFSASVSVRL